MLSRLHCNGHSLRVGSYLSRIGRIENPFCSVCGHYGVRRNGVVVKASASQSVDLGFIPFVESYLKTLKKWYL